MNTYPRVYLTYHGDGNVGIGTPPQVASAPLGEPVEHLRVSHTNKGAGMTDKEKAYALLRKLADETTYVMVHPNELRILLDDLDHMRLRVRIAREELSDAWQLFRGDMA